MATGLTPLLNRFKANNKILWFPHFGSGSVLCQAQTGNNLTLTSDFELKKGALRCKNIAGATLCSTANVTINNISELTFISCYIPINGVANTGIRPLQWDGGNCGIYTLTASQYRFVVLATGGAISISPSGVKTGKRNFCSASFKENIVDGLTAYINGIPAAAPVSTVGKTAFNITAQPFSIRMGTGSEYDICYNVVILQSLTAQEHAQIYSELESISYETQDCFWPVSATVYWRGAFGALARETAMAAGRSIGDINELVVASGTHKMSTEILDGILTKCLVCVTNGTINLPAYNLGANYVFEKFTASTGLWTTVTQANRAVALLAGDKILWANQTGNRHIKRIY